MKLYSLIIIILITLISCNRSNCKECYLIENINGSTQETSIGTFCDEEIEEKENQNLIAPSGTAHNECR